MYKFYFRYNYESENKVIEFPLAPDKLITNVCGKNDVIETIGLGEVNVIKDIGLRELRFKVFLPRDISCFSEGLSNLGDYEPIKILNALREIMEKRCVVTLIIERILPDNSRIFNGNTKVSLENYIVDENAGQEGCFWVEIFIKEYRAFNAIEYNVTNQINAEGNSLAVEVIKRDSKPTQKSYIVKAGDSLWKIAKMQLNDGSRYKEIAKMNNISNPDKISVGTKLLLP